METDIEDCGPVPENENELIEDIEPVGDAVLFAGIEPVGVNEPVKEIEAFRETETNEDSEPNEEIELTEEFEPVEDANPVEAANPLLTLVLFWGLVDEVTFGDMELASPQVNTLEKLIRISQVHEKA